ncbi:PHD finger protein 20-like protein 1 [Trichoplax sp. H2]|nr:PHD finger protein 20-like protein 1 [Trichoplax sp. H2]|eukprot:RDD39330.1 PHD finger protein 20-like protein 1 [Trichoplax sp. H2]
MIEKKIKPSKLTIPLEVGTRVEAKDYCGKWYPSKIKDVDEKNQEVLIHFEGWSSRFDEWIDLKSSRLRPTVRTSSRKTSSTASPILKEWQCGEHVLARWSDCRYYSGKILARKQNGLYEVLFDDGYKKLCLPATIKEDPRKPKVSTNSTKVDRNSPGFASRNPKSSRSSARRMQSQRLSDASSIGPYSIDATSESETSDATDSSRENKKTLSATNFIHAMARNRATLKCGNLRKHSSGKQNGRPLTTSAGSTNSNLISPRTRSKKLGIDEIASKLIKLAKTRKDQNHLVYGPESNKRNGESNSLGEINGISVTKRPLAELKQINAIDNRNSASSRRLSLRHDKNQKSQHQKRDHKEEIEKEPISTLCKCPFPGCGKTFRKTANLESHHRHYHDTKRKEDRSSKLKLASTNRKRSVSTTDVELSRQRIKRRRTSVPPRSSLANHDSNIKNSKHASDDDSNSDQDIVRCLCGKNEEMGLMLQCEKCLTWQHTECIEVDSDNIPVNYLCYLCLCPPGQRQRSKFKYHSNWQKSGVLASLLTEQSSENVKARSQLLRRCGSLIADMNEISSVMHGLWMKVNMFSSKDNHIDLEDFVKCLNVRLPSAIRRDDEKLKIPIDSNSKSSNDCSKDTIPKETQQNTIKMKGFQKSDCNVDCKERTPINNCVFSTNHNVVDLKSPDRDPAINAVHDSNNHSSDICKSSNDPSLNGYSSPPNDAIGSKIINGSGEQLIGNDSLFADAETWLSHSEGSLSSLLSDRLRLLMDINAAQNQVNNSFDIIEARLHDIESSSEDTVTSIVDRTFKAGKSLSSCNNLDSPILSTNADCIRTVVIDENKARRARQNKCFRDCRWLKFRKTIQDLQWLKLLAAIVNEPFKE